jgi:XTP/dITP diphosphohydrolase
VRLTLLGTSPRVAPGLLSGSAWRAVEAADRVLAGDLATVEALRAAGVACEHVPDPAPWLDGRPVPEGDDHVVLLLDAALLPDGAPAASYDLPGGRLLDLVAVMDRLRAECPWDREQTHRSLATYLLEETYETLEAIDSGDHEHLREELGDLLLQVVFHARVAAERGADGFDIDDVAGGIADKLVYRHPHVFAGLEVADAAEVDRNWEALKAAEKQRSSPVEGVPRALPALAYAEKVVGRLAKAGVLPDDPARAAGAGDGPGPDLGAELLRLVVAARSAGLDAEQELRDAVRRLIAATS